MFGAYETVTCERYFLQVSTSQTPSKIFKKAGHTMLIIQPIGGLCIAPVLLTKVLKNITVTIGNDEKTATDVEKMGGVNINTSHGEVISDKRNKIYTSPCYMLNANLMDIHDCAYNLVSTMLDNM